ncbi:hypothetical protein [Kibdelosporangium aridum]|uniref:hypothetical protein n=1 Tax=Kibdelosporangium aridum TaxID=2030 RepID=UPI00163D000A|nr:hypothetical protein [Kibdelosporangium aridum]
MPPQVIGLGLFDAGPAEARMPGKCQGFGGAMSQVDRALRQPTERRSYQTALAAAPEL